MKHKYLLFVIALLMCSVTTFADENDLTIQDLKALISTESGTLTFPSDDTRKVSGVVISDAGNLNMETNPQTAYNAIDFSDNLKTAYVQSADGSSGLRIKTAATTVITNHFVRYNTVTIQLKEATLEKESNPTRYTLRGIDNARVTAQAGIVEDIVTKIKAINELTDTDIYTFVELKNVEVSVPYGTWTNVKRTSLIRTDWNPSPSGTTAPRVDAVPTSIRDNNSGHMKVLTNGRASWCRNPLPTGSGSIKGIITHSKLKRFAAEGNIGKYAIRALSESDIQLTNSAKGITLVEWNWMTNGDCSDGTITKDSGDNTKVLARTGTGTLTSTYPDAMASAALYYHPLCTSVTNVSTALTIGLQPNTKKWYDTATNTGEGFIFNFSTAGINTTTGENLTLNFSQGGGNASDATMAIPLDWQVEYSTDGENYTKLSGSDYSVRPYISDGLQQLFSCPGLQDHSFTLPNTLLGQDNVWVRLVVASDRCGSITDLDGGESGLISATTGTTDLRVRLGVVSIKYQKTFLSSVHEGNADGAKVYLSASGMLKVESAKVVKNMGVYSLNGQCLFSKAYNTSNIEADLTSLQSSVYIVKIHTETGVVTSKIVKK